MQTDDTLILASNEFLALEEDEFNKAKFPAKTKETLITETPLIFNGCILSKNGDEMKLKQKDQGKKL